MLDEFLGWWLARWREILPQAWVAAASDRVPVLLLGPDRLDDPSRLRARLRQGQTVTPLGDIALGPGADRALAAIVARAPRRSQALLEVPDDTVLARDVTLPLAAEADLDRLLGYEMDRLTPFPADAVLHGHEIRRRDRAANRLVVSLFVVPLARVRATLDALADAGIKPAALEGRDAGGVRRRVPLGAHGSGPRRNALQHGAWALAIGLVLIALAAPFARQSAALSRADSEREALAPRTRDAVALRGRIAASAAGSDVLADATARTADPMAVLATLTARLPDDTYITDLSMNGRTVTLNGQSASAAKLIGLLAADPTISNPAFSAPVTRLEATHSDLFSIRASVVADPALANLPGHAQPAADGP